MTERRPHYDRDAIVRRLADPESVLRQLGVEASKQGRWHFISCPVHSERTPSCSVQEVDGVLLWHCKGCGSGGGVIDLVAALRGLSIADAIAAAAELAGVDGEVVTGHRHSGADGVGAGQPNREQKGSPVTGERFGKVEALADEDFAALIDPLAHVGRLDDSAIARDVTAYLARRGLLEEARATGWFALGEEEQQASAAAMLVDVFGEEMVRASGLMNDQLRISWSSHRLCIPWRDPDGTVCTLQRRRLGGPEKGKYVFASGRTQRWPYGIERLATAGRRDGHAPYVTELVFVEGAVDVLARRILDRGRDRVALGLPGVGAWKPAWADCAKGRSVLVALDNDAPGDGAVQKLVDDLYRAGAAAVQRSKPKGGAKDWASLVEHHNRDSVEL